MKNTSIRSRHAFTLMEILVVIAIIVVLAAIAFPVYGRIKANSNKGTALSVMRQLGSALGGYCAEHDGTFPNEDITGKDDWDTSIKPEADTAWYNALPRKLGMKSVGDFKKENRIPAFYTKENLLYLPGAQYPDGDKKLQKPFFAIAINTKLQRKDKDGKKADIRLQNVSQPSRTVAFIEQGLPGEPKAHDTIGSGDYDGSPKGSAKSFVARYTGRGIIAFVDGNAAEKSGKDLLTSTGEIVWDKDAAETDQSMIIWTADPKEDPNAKAGTP